MFNLNGKTLDIVEVVEVVVIVNNISRNIYIICTNIDTTIHYSVKLKTFYR